MNTKKPKTGNATCICDHIRNYISSGSGNEKLELLASWLYEYENIQVSFCRIFRKRWAHQAGDRDLLMPVHRVQLEDSWGMLTGDISADPERWRNIVTCIQNIIKENGL